MAHRNHHSLSASKHNSTQNRNHNHRQQPPSAVPVSVTYLNNMEKINMVPGFILKLWKMINDPQCDDLISWSENGQSFIIMDPPRFSQELSKYFKHNNLSSFIRQLNMYGFRKVATIENSGLHPSTDDLHFYHPDFIRDKPEKLDEIKRKLPQKLADSVDLRNVYRGITEIEDKQKDVSKTLQDIRRENELLWAELHDLRQKHQQQQLYISRLMKLVFEAMEQNGIKTNMLQIKRNCPLMIEAASGLEATSTSHMEPTTVPSPTTQSQQQVSNTPTGQQSSNPSNVVESNVMGAVLSTPSPSLQADLLSSQLTTTQPIAATTMAGDDMHSIKKSRIASPINGEGCEQYQQQQQQHQQSGRQLRDPAFDLQQALEINAPLDATGFEASNQYHMLQNDQLQSQVDSAEYQIDTLVPTIGDFEQDELNLFAD